MRGLIGPNPYAPTEDVAWLYRLARIPDANDSPSTALYRREMTLLIVAVAQGIAPRDDDRFDRLYASIIAGQINDAGRASNGWGPCPVAPMDQQRYDALVALITTHTKRLESERASV